MPHPHPRCPPPHAPWSSPKRTGSPWISLDLPGARSPWSSPKWSGSPWISLDLPGFSWTSISLELPQSVRISRSTSFRSRGPLPASAHHGAPATADDAPTRPCAGLGMRDGEVIDHIYVAGMTLAGPTQVGPLPRSERGPWETATAQGDGSDHAWVSAPLTVSR